MHYVTVHALLRRTRGRAPEHTCRECGEPAEQWAYLYNGDPELYGDNGTPYADDLERCYAPMCRRCHRQFDLRNDPRLKKVMAAAGAKLGALTGSLKANTTRRRCLECGLVAHPGGVGAHQSASGHTGYETT